MKYIAEKLNFTKQSISEMKSNSKKFYIKMKKRRSVRYFERKSININISRYIIIIQKGCRNTINWDFISY